MHCNLFVYKLCAQTCQVFIIFATVFVSVKVLNLVAGINSMRQMEIFRILSGILHLGNVELLEDKADSCYISVRNCSCAVCGTLLWTSNSYA